MSIAEDLGAQLGLYRAALNGFTKSHPKPAKKQDVSDGTSQSESCSSRDITSSTRLRQMSVGESNGSDNL